MCLYHPHSSCVSCLFRTDIDSKVERHEEDITAYKQDLEDKKKQFDSLRDDVQSAHYKYHDITNALERLKDKLDAASMDQRELEKQRQNRELLENLKRLFPGVVSSGRLWWDLLSNYLWLFVVAMQLSLVTGRN